MTSSTTDSSTSSSWGADDWMAAAGIGGTLLSFIGGEQDRQSAEAQSRAMVNFQRDAFQQSQHQTIQNRVRDARKAGISPLAALGVPGTQVPSFAGRVGGTSSTATNAARAINELAEQYQRQEIYRSQAETKKVQAETDAVQLQNMIAQGKLLEAEVNKLSVAPGGKKMIDQYGREVEMIPAFRGAYDNRTNDLPPDALWVLDEEVAEGMEGTGGLWTSGIANVQPPIARAWNAFKAWIAGETGLDDLEQIDKELLRRKLRHEGKNIYPGPPRYRNYWRENQ